MPIQRCSEQRRCTLEEFYSEKEMGAHYAYCGEQMLCFIKLINELFPKTQLFGVTSHFRLVVQREDSTELDWFIIVSALAGDFYFEYLMPERKAPWRKAYVGGVANSLEEAKEYLLIAMKECEAWKDNAELNQLLTDYRIKGM